MMAKCKKMMRILALVVMASTNVPAQAVDVKKFFDVLVAAEPYFDGMMRCYFAVTASVGGIVTLALGIIAVKPDLTDIIKGSGDHAFRVPIGRPEVVRSFSAIGALYTGFATYICAQAALNAAGKKLEKSTK